MPVVKVIEVIASSEKSIEDAIQNNEFEKRKELVQNQKIKSLNEDQFFPWIVKILDNKNSNLKKTTFILKLNVIRKNICYKLLKRIYNKVKSLI